MSPLTVTGAVITGESAPNLRGLNGRAVASSVAVAKDGRVFLGVPDWGPVVYHPEERRLTLFAADFLDFPLPSTPYKVFASIPYNATAAIVGKLTSGIDPPKDAYLVVQREAAQRFIGWPNGTLVAAQLHPWFHVSIEHAFRRTDFRPVPAVESVLLRLRLRAKPLVPPSQRDRYLDLVVAIFTRRQLLRMNFRM